MNLFAFLKTGAAHAPSEAQRAQAAVDKATEETRAQWLNSLFVDQTRAWMAIGEHEPGVLEGMSIILTLAGMAHLYDLRDINTTDMRVIRGGISAATQCAATGGRVSVDDARAFSSAAVRAQAIIRGASADAIIHAATSIRKVVGLPKEVA
jgi:hypothetical protein